MPHSSCRKLIQRVENGGECNISIRNIILNKRDVLFTIIQTKNKVEVYFPNGGHKIRKNGLAENTE